MKLENGLIVCTTGMVAGIVTGAARPGSGAMPQAAWIVLLAACAGWIWLALLAGRKKRRRLAAGLGLLLFATAGVAGWTRFDAANRPAAPGSLRQFLERHPVISNLAIRGTVCREPETASSHSILLTIAVSESRLGTGTWHRVTGEKIRVSVISRKKQAPGETIADERPELASLAAYGDSVEATVFRIPFAAKSDGRTFDARKMQEYLRREGYAGQLTAHAKNVAITEYARGNPVVECALALKGRMLAVFRREFDEPVARLSAGVVLGRGREVQGASYRGRPLMEVFAETGISHVLSVSGLHVSMVAGTVFGLLRKLRLPRLPAAIAGSAAVWFYVLLTGSSTAAVRAGVMNSFGMIFYGLGMKPLEKAALAGLCVAAWVSLLPNPLLIGAVGFQLSFGSVLALILLTPRVDALLQRTGGGGLMGLGMWLAVTLVLASRQMAFVATVPGFAVLAALLAACLWAGHALDARHPGLHNRGYARLPALVRGLLATQIAIQAGLLLPLSGWYFEHFSVAGCLVNLVAIPLSNVYIQVALVCGLLGAIPGVGAWLASWAAIPADLLGTGFLELAFRGAGLFGYPAVARPGVQTLVLYYMLLAVVVVWFGSRWRAPHLAAPPPAIEPAPAFL